MVAITPTMRKGRFEICNFHIKPNNNYEINKSYYDTWNRIGYDDAI